MGIFGIEPQQTPASVCHINVIRQTCIAEQEIPSLSALKQKESEMIRNATVSRAIKYSGEVANVDESESGAEKSS